MKSIKILILATVTTLFCTPVLGDEPPNFYKGTFPEHALESTLESGAILFGKDAKLDAKTRELIGLGVAAQIPCSYCVYVHD